jgi:hypothetical protein
MNRENVVRKLGGNFAAGCGPGTDHPIDIYRVFQNVLNDKTLSLSTTTLPLMKYGVRYILTHLKFI